MMHTAAFIEIRWSGGGWLKRLLNILANEVHLLLVAAHENQSILKRVHGVLLYIAGVDVAAADESCCAIKCLIAPNSGAKPCPGTHKLANPYPYPGKSLLHSSSPDARSRQCR